MEPARPRPRLPEAVVGDAATNGHVTDVLASVVDVRNRMAGHEGEAAGAAVVADALADAGLAVRRDRFGIDGWWRGSSSLVTDRSPADDAVAGDGDRFEASHEVVALPGSPAATATGRVVDVGPGRPRDVDRADLAGAIAVVGADTPGGGRWRHRMEKYAGAVEAGASAFVFRNHVPGALPPTGEVGYGERPAPIPAVGVSKEVGARLRRHASDGPVDATVAVDCETGPARSVNVAGDVGPATDEVVLVTAHHDAHDLSEGAADDAAGCAVVAEVGRLLVRAADAGVDLGCRVRCATFGAEEVGLRGAEHAAAGIEDAVRCVVNVDGVARTRDVRAITNGHTDLERTLVEAAAALGVPLSSDAAVVPHGDQWAFVRRGTPGVMVTAAPEGAGRGWGHTHADTVEKIDGRDLRAQATFVAEVAARAAAPDAGYERRTPADVREAIDPGYERELRAGGRWPFAE